MKNTKTASLHLLTACLGLMLSFAVYHWEQRKRQQDFNYIAHEHAMVLQNSFEHLLETMYSLQKVLQIELSEDHLDPLGDISRRIMGEAFSQQAFFQHIAWLQSHSKSQQQSLLVVGKQTGQAANWQTGTSLKQLKLTRPFQEQNHHLQLIPAHEKNFLYFFVPVQGNEHLWLMIRVSSDHLVEHALHKMPVAAADIDLMAQLANDTNLLLYHHPSRSRSSEQAFEHTGIIYRNSFTSADQTFTLKLEAAPAFLDQHPLNLSYQAALFSLLSFFLFLLFLYRSNSNKQRMKAIIAEKTQQIRQEQRLFKDLIQHAPTMISIRDLQDHYLHINQQYCDVHQISQTEALATPLEQRFDAETLQDIRQSDAIVLKTGKEYRFEEHIGTHHYLSLKFPLYDDQEHIYALCCISTDRSDELRLLQQSQRLSTIIEQSSNLILLTNADGIIEYVNPAFEQCTGYSASEVIGQNPKIVSSGKHSKAFYEELWSTITQGKNWTADFTNRKKDGSLYYVSQHITPLSDSQGTITGYVSVQQDISEQRHLQHSLQHSDRVKALGVLAGGIAHDFNNLLTSIIGNAHRIKQAKGNDKSLQAILKSANTAAKLCKQMLDYSGQGDFLMQPLDLHKTLQHISDIVQVSVPQNVHFSIDIQAGLQPILADESQIQQVILNLALNAFESIHHEQGKVQLRLFTQHINADTLSQCINKHDLKPGHYSCLSIRDNGCGIDEQTLKKIFDPFFSTKETGRGLGMSALLGILQAHHAGLIIDSVVQQGTSMQVLFPICQTEKNPPSQPKPQAANKQPKTAEQTAEQTILIVDDEASIREVLSFILQDAGYRVLQADDGLAGLQIFKQHKDSIAMVVLDMTMPRMNGEACYQAMQAIRPELKVLFSSGYSENSQEIDSNTYIRFLQKPYTPAELLAHIEELLHA